MTDVPIPTEFLEVTRSTECRQWLLDHTSGGVQGHFFGGRFAFRFDDPAEADAFKERWLS
jgi:hypothetical protein